MKYYAIKLAFEQNTFWSTLKQQFTSKWLFADMFSTKEEAEIVMVNIASFYAPCHLIEIDPQNN